MKWAIQCCMLCALTAMAVPAQAFDCGKKAIKLAFYEFGLLYDQGLGIDKEIVDELKRRTHCHFHVQVMPRARIWADLASGALDMSVSGIQTPERDQFAWFIPYLSLKNYTLLDATLASQVKTAEAFLQNDKTQFGIVRSFRHGKQQDAFIARMQALNRVQESPDVGALFGKLKEGRVQGVFAPPVVFRHQLRKLNIEPQLLVQDWSPHEKGIPHGLILAKASFSETQMQAWQGEISAMRADGTLRRIYRQFLPEPEVAQLLDF
ncbi:transporter substrate-binding domain-containing protein [Chitinibacter fontanus]|uniref:Transporter substrate-binding domain-containing protein n=1 Tax=Chitinibacter fontanus TaxID=1737446 RepID=A0A7D5Z4S7_9NEIS|nr:transporter substrate-binding domain-containing protein [Chitinibacter fontanus]QLI81123.1 transporter substrate-binding domain-containing protein [Chitinibacter fontanus]